MEWHSSTGRGLYRDVITIGVVLAVLIVPLTGAVAAQEDAGNATENGSFVATQGEQCMEIQTFVGTKTPREFYDYRLPIENNSYANQTGQSYSSEGPTDLQRANTSVVFLYQQVPDEAEQITGQLQPEDPGVDNRSLSLVIVHGSLENDSAGGAVTFDITGLPEDGRWTVKDDEYDGPQSYDNWSADSGDTVVDWTWGEEATDGGVYTGLDEGANVTIRPAFNEEADLWQEHYDGRVDDWELLSNETSGDDGTTNSSNVTRIPLDKSVPLQLSGGDCEAVTDRNVTDEEPTADSGEQTDDGPIVIGDDVDISGETTEEPEENETADGPIVIEEPENINREAEMAEEPEENETDDGPIVIEEPENINREAEITEDPEENETADGPIVTEETETDDGPNVSEETEMTQEPEETQTTEEPEETQTTEEPEENETDDGIIILGSDE